MKLVPVVFVHFCCPAPGVLAGQDANGDVYWRRISWSSDRPWKAVPPPLGATPRRGSSAKTATRKQRPRR